MKAIVAIAVILLFAACDEEGLIDYYEIKAFTNESHMEGAFFVAAGQMGQVTEYVVLKIQEDGGLVRVEIPSDRAVIYEDSRSTPHVEVIGFGSVACTFNIYIPEGSIWYGYELDIRKE